MPRGDKSKYTDKQERKADHIAESYEARGVSEKEAERRAWATVNKDDGGGKKSGSGRGAHTGHPAAHKGGELGARRPHRDPQRHARHRRRKPPRRESATTPRISTTKRGPGWLFPAARAMDRRVSRIGRRKSFRIDCRPRVVTQKAWPPKEPSPGIGHGKTHRDNTDPGPHRHQGGCGPLRPWDFDRAGDRPLWHRLSVSLAASPVLPA